MSRQEQGGVRRPLSGRRALLGEFIMHILNNLLIAGTSAAVFFGHAAPALAQGTNSETKAPSADVVVVTGRAGASDRSREEVSYALTQLSREDLNLQAPISTAEVLKAIPGFWVEASGGEASNNVRTRGIPTDGFSSVALMEDGLTIQHDGGLGYLNADQSFRLDQTISRVEAVRGGPSSIFAANAPGGTVNFITRKAGSRPEGVVKAEVGDYGMYRTDFFYGAPISEGWGFTIGGFYRSDEGVRSPGFTQNQGGQIRVGLSHAWEGGSLDINVKHINDNVGFLLPVPLTFDASRHPAAIPGFDPNYGTLAGPETRLASFRTATGQYAFDLGRGTDVSLTAITGKLSLDLGDGWKLEDTARYRTSDILRNGLFPTGSIETAQGRLNGQLNAAKAAYPTATAVQYRYVTSGQSFDVVNQNGNGLVVSGNLLSVAVPLDEFVNDLRFVKTFDFGGQKHDVAFGAYFADYKQGWNRQMATANLEVRDQARLVNILAVDASGAVVGSVTENGILRYGSLYDNARTSARDFAFYASDEWQITDALRIDGGIRYEKVDITGSVEGKQTVNLGIATTLADNSVTTGTGVFQPINRSYSNTSYTLGADYQFSRDLGVFARYTDTARLPSSSEFQGSTGDALRTDIRVTPITMLEAGVKYQSDILDVYATAFDTKFQNVRFTDNVFSTVTNSFTTRVGYADTLARGVELEGVIRPFDFLDVSGAVSWQKPEYDKFRFTENVGGTPVARNFSGNQLIRVPEIGARLVPGLNLLDGAVRIEFPVEYYSKRFADAANSQSLRPYMVLNFNARWKLSDRFALSLAGVNLSNEIGLTEGNPRAGQFISGDAGARYYLARPVLGRSWRLSATYSF